MNAPAPPPPDPTREQLLAALAERDRELADARETRDATAEILKVIAGSPGDTQPVFDAIARSAKRLLGGFTASVYRIADGVVGVAAYTLTGAEADAAMLATFPRPADDQMIADYARHGFVEIADAEAELEGPRLESARARGFLSSLAVPLTIDGVFYGAIAVSRRERGKFAPRQIQLLQTFADQAAIAIQNARLFDDTRRALERQTATSEILKVIAASPSDTAPVFEAIAHSANRLLGGLSTAVWRFEGEIAHLAAYTPTNPEADAALRAMSPLPVRELSVFVLLSEGEIARVPDTEQGPERLRDLARLRGFRAMLFTPLIQFGKSMGFVSVTRKAPGAFASDDVELLKTFADQAVIAIQNARLFNETREALEQQQASGEVLAAIGQSVSDAAPVFEKILDACQRLFGGDEVGVYTIDEAERVRVAAWRGAKAEEVRRDVTPLADSYTGRVIRERRVHHIPNLGALPDISEKLRERVTRLGGAALIYAPMLWKDRGLGSIVVSRAPPRPFSEKEQILLQGFADQAAIAVENARLFNETQARARDLTASLENLRKTQDRLIQTEKLASLGQLTAGIAHEIKNPLNFVNNFAALSGELTDELLDILGPAPLDDKLREDVDELTKMLKDNLRKVASHGQRADSIVKNMLLHSRAGSGERRASDVNAILEESLNLAYHGARAETPGFDITLKRDLDPDAGMIDLYPQEISRAFLNLISNGFYAATHRERIAGFEPALGVATRAIGESVEIRVRDNGAGIPAEVRDKIFNPFFTTKPAGEGTGLGLSMTHDIVVKQHGGTIDVISSPGEFTEFRIVLPRGGTA